MINFFSKFYEPKRFFEQGNQISIVVAIETKGTGPEGERVDELTPYVSFFIGGGKGELFLDFIINTLKPYVDKTFRTNPSRESTSIVGSSLGGLFSLYAGLKYQSVFSKIGSISPGFIANLEIYYFVSTVNKQFDDLRVYFACGDQENDMLPTVESDMIYMYEVLEKRGFTYVNFTVARGANHSEFYWKHEFPNAYKWIFNF